MRPITKKEYEEGRAMALKNIDQWYKFLQRLETRWKERKV